MKIMAEFNFDSVLFEEWRKDYGVDAPMKIDPQLVHKCHVENVCVSKIEQVSLEKEQYLTLVAVDIRHPFFFDHVYDHVPGMLFVEAGRQAATAVAHQYYDIPYDVGFILKDINFSFSSYAELEDPLFISSSISEKEYRNGQLVSMKHDGVFIQNGKEIASMGGIWKIIDKKLIERMRRKS